MQNRSPKGLFVKGRSGNPKGRPKRPRELGPLLAMILDEPVAMKIGAKTVKATRLEATIRIYFDECMRTKKFDPRVMSLLIEAASQSNFELDQADQDELSTLILRGRS